MINLGLPPICLIVGAPATGKSTVSRALAARYPKSIAICVDDLRSMVISGVVHPSATWSSELTEQLQLARKSATETAYNSLERRFFADVNERSHSPTGH